MGAVPVRQICFSLSQLLSFHEEWMREAGDEEWWQLLPSANSDRELSALINGVIMLSRGKKNNTEYV